MKLKYFKYLCLSLLLVVPGIAPAAMVSYGLNLSNELGLPSTIDYATVTIKDDQSGADANAIRFEIETNNAFFDEGPNFGIQAFYFNADMLLPMVTVDLIPPEPG